MKVSVYDYWYIRSWYNKLYFFKHLFKMSIITYLKLLSVHLTKLKNKSKRITTLIKIHRL